MDYLQIALLVLVVVGVWAVVEIALTMRSARRDIEKVTTSANDLIEQVQPVVAKLDGVVDELEPAAKHMAPLAESAETTIAAANVSVERLNGILADVSAVSGTASSVTGAVNRVAESAASGVASVMSRITGSGPAEHAAQLEEAPEVERAELPDRAPVRYVDYGEVSAVDAPTTEDTEQEK